MSCRCLHIKRRWGTHMASRSVPAKEAPISTNETLIEVAKRVPLGVLCLSSALRFHELTTENPFEVWLAIERGAWSPKLDYPPVRVVHFSEAAFKFGIETHSVEGEPCASIARRRPLRITSSSAPRLEWRPRSRHFAVPTVGREPPWTSCGALPRCAG
jgi:hypothetical protein